jgi:hypothetical protein
MPQLRFVRSIVQVAIYPDRDARALSVTTGRVTRRNPARQPMLQLLCRSACRGSALPSVTAHDTADFAAFYNQFLWLSLRRWSVGA